MKNRECVIIGSGPAGYTAAIYCRRAGIDTLLLTGDIDGGQLTQTSKIENFPGFPEGIDGYLLMDNMKKQALSFGLEESNATVVSAELSGKEKVLNLSDGNSVSALAVIIATGATPRHLGVSGEDEFSGKGVSYCATCDGFFFRGKTVAVVGGGDTAAEEALYLSSLASKVYMIVRKPYLRASDIMRRKVEEKENINVLFSTVVVRAEGSMKLENLVIKFPDGEKELPIDGLFPAIGHDPVTAIFSPSVKTDAQGYIITAPHSTATNIEGVFAAGDVADPYYRQAITAAASGCKAAMDAERYIKSL